MGIGASAFGKLSFFRGSSSSNSSNAAGTLQSGDVGNAASPQTNKGAVALVNSSQQPVGQKADAVSQDGPLAKTASDEGTPHAPDDSQDSSTKRRHFYPQETVTRVQRDGSPTVWKAEYPPSPMKTVRTSTSSYMMSSETVLAYPSPAKLHSPPLSYTSSYRKVSPVVPAIRSRLYDDAEDSMADAGGRGPFYSGIPSPMWKPINRRSVDGRGGSQNSSASPFGRQSSWNYNQSPEWQRSGLEGSRVPARRNDRLYFNDQGKVEGLKPHEMPYF